MESVAALREWRNLKRSSKVVPPNRKELPEPSPERLRASFSDCAFDVHSLILQESLPKNDSITGQPGTLLYLAYGSNLCAETFQGMRGIRPLSAINVVVPELVMTFDLGGIPYTEPCFANTKYRHTTTSAFSPTSEKSTLLSSSLSSPQPTNPGNPPQRNNYHKTSWPHGLVGVVYEVTPTDFAHILATEGGGSAYQDILVGCYPLPPGTSHVPEQPRTEPFKAHTLFSPVCRPPHRGEAEEGDPSCCTASSCRKRGSFCRPDPNYAQPSARYLKLITDGADEHAFPADYKAYLWQLRPYTVTSWRQKVGGILFRAFWLPVIHAVFMLGSLFADDRGRIPTWYLLFAEAVFQGVWISYDVFFYHVFGDGERTQYEDGDEEKVG